jgi:aspartate/methionine/tyrosine aminotransferase
MSPAQGTYFLVADATPFLRPGEDDVAFCMRLTRQAGVTLIPVSAFYTGEARPRHLVRFCFCKEDAKLLAACERLESYLGGAAGGSGASNGAAAAAVAAVQ